MSLERLTVMVVEDSPFVRNMMQEILRALRVGKVLLAADGGEAIGMLRQVSQQIRAVSSSAAQGVLAIDIILSDFVMSPINGAMLLRWVRNHDESPDRFIPFVMISGAADSEKVREARDLGMTEFLAKPFSVKSVADHLTSAIEYPRQFVYTRDYFGPDRRRQKRPYADVERRTITPDEIEVLHSGAKLKQFGGKTRAFNFRLPNRLREKIAGIGGAPVRIAPELLQQAEQQLDRMENDYADWVRGSMRTLAQAHRRAVDEEHPRKRAALVATVNKVAHDLRGQGSTFGYPLITVFGRSLYECTDGVSDVTDSLLDFIKSHVDGINAVLRDRIKGNGGEIGEALVKSLEEAREKLSQ